jgi:hypothetical protein
MGVIKDMREGSEEGCFGAEWKKRKKKGKNTAILIFDVFG